MVLYCNKNSATSVGEKCKFVLSFDVTKTSAANNSLCISLVILYDKKN